jgi:hypothetical protein
MIAVPFHADPRLFAILTPLYVAATGLALGLLLRRFIARFLEEDDPGRQLVLTGRALCGSV